RVGLVDDDQPAPPLERPVGGAIDRLADLVDLDAAGVAGLDDEDVGMDAAGDAAAGGAFTARVATVIEIDRTLAVQRLGQGRRGETLTDAVRAGEDQARRQRAARGRAGEQRQHRPVTRDRPERHLSAIYHAPAAAARRRSTYIGSVP